MNHKSLWMLALLMFASVMLSACMQKPVSASKIVPAKVETIAGTNLKRLILTQDAAKRLAIQTTPAREEQVSRKWIVGGEVVALPTAAATISDLNKILVRLDLGESGIKRVRRVESALVMPLTSASTSALASTLPLTTQPIGIPLTNPSGSATGPVPASALPLTAQPIDAPKNVPDVDPTTELYYLVDSANHGLVPGQRVFVQLVLVGSGALRKIIPYSAVLYDKEGKTWTYTNPEPLVFVRQVITVDYIEGDQAILTEGPAAGTLVVTVGEAELFGAEVGVGK
ncbi:MAG: hypothetical protein HZB51_13635 [Chloroflexi bacterium]|nr:hypothetical protein [Chloroflexota bacterium]